MFVIRLPNLDSGEPTLHTLAPYWMPKPLPPRNQCTDVSPQPNLYGMFCSCFVNSSRLLHAQIGSPAGRLADRRSQLKLVFKFMFVIKLPNLDSGELILRTLALYWMPKPLPPRNQCTDCFAPTRLIWHVLFMFC